MAEGVWWSSGRPGQALEGAGAGTPLATSIPPGKSLLASSPTSCPWSKMAWVASSGGGISSGALNRCQRSFGHWSPERYFDLDIALNCGPLLAGIGKGQEAGELLAVAGGLLAQCLKISRYRLPWCHFRGYSHLASVWLGRRVGNLPPPKNRVVKDVLTGTTTT